MEQRTATIPFDLEMAKKINIGAIEGRIVTEKGRNRAEIVYEDNSSICPLLVVIHSISVSAIRCMVNDELKQKEGYGFVGKICKEVIKDHVLNELNIIVSPKNERCVCENRVPSRKDGLYLIYGNGHAEPFTGENFKKNVRYIGLKHKDVSFAISLTEHDSVRLLDNDSRKESGSETYYERECDALFDIDGRGNTERLVARNPKLRNLLEDDEYIPSLGQLNLMAHHMDELNKAFAYVSASPLSSARYWSSTEYSKVSAWFVSFSIGGTHSNIEYNSYRVRAVIDF